MRPRRRGAGRGGLVAEHYHRRSISARLDGPDLTIGLPALTPEELAFVESIEAEARPGALVEIIEARYGP
ncbi:MAG: hypothetical protein M5U14_09430, partial [Acidimicrobiia bacterium]|nr:hypothetical protein [Acidimicrobiia bacterium]